MYYALYRKYRPLTFNQVVGQEHVTQTLKNQIKNGQFAHAYLFTGTRGTGKTSCAKIFARAVNCLNPQDGDPCNECEICKGLLDGSLYDVIEIDAASNNGVDNIRQLRDEIVYTPVKAKFKVYIIDEVHMLSAGAFNALLKTLEEPPSHAIFILATTEAHKVPATILSRCQRFDMHRLNVKIIADLLASVIESENRNMPENLVNLIASLADGSVRDGLSILDKVLELENPEDIKKVLGLCDNDTLFSLSSAISDGDVDKLYSSVEEFYTSSRDFGILCHDLLEHFRLLLIVQASKHPETLIEKSKDEISEYIKEGKKFSSEHILYVMDLLQQTIQGLSRSIDKRADTEICLLRCANPELSVSPAAIAARLEKLESRLQKGETLPLSQIKTVQTDGKSITQPFSVSSEESVKNSGKTSDEDINGDKTAPFEPVSKVSSKKSKEQSVKEMKEMIEERKKNIIEKEKLKNINKEAEASGNTIENPEISKVDDSQDTDVYKEYISWDIITDNVKKNDILLVLTLSRSCQALYKGKTLLLLCSRKSDLEMINNPKNRELLQKALEEDRKFGYTIKVELGEKSKYLNGEQQQFSQMYDKITDSDLFR